MPIEVFVFALNQVIYGKKMEFSYIQRTGKIFQYLREVQGIFGIKIKSM